MILGSQPQSLGAEHKILGFKVNRLGSSLKLLDS